MTCTRFVLGLALAHCTAVAGNLQVQIEPRFKSGPLVFDSLTHEIASGQRVSVTRLDFLLSNFALQRIDGTWLDVSNTFAFINARQGLTSCTLTNLPEGRYNRLRFSVGVSPGINHSKPAQYPAKHPLNPTVNGLHWSWQGGYVFLALEGRWTAPDGALSGFSYHLATDARLMTAEVPVSISLAGDTLLKVDLDVGRILSGKAFVRISDETSSTHSREGDELAVKLAEAVEAAFSIRAEAALSGQGGLKAESGRQLSPAELQQLAAMPLSPAVERTVSVKPANGVTPYRFTVPNHFEVPELPQDNPLSEEGIALGRRLFHEPLLSINGKQSCASCHQAERGSTDGTRYSIGAEGQAGTRNAMPLFNLAWKTSFFWDGRAPALREQVLMPIQDPREMHESLPNVVAKLEGTQASFSGEADAGPKIVDYAARFESAFGTREITADRVARALEQFLLTLVSSNSKYDRVMYGSEKFTDEEHRGHELFFMEYDPRLGQFGADCFHCHSGSFLKVGHFANNGLELEPVDLGRFLVTGWNGDKGRFAVPSLRNVALTAPYMHDGRFKTLEEVVEHYNTGVKRSEMLDSNLAKHPDGGVHLNDADKRALVAFLKTLTDEEFLLLMAPGNLQSGTHK